MDNWTDIGIILKIEKRGEKGNLLNVFTNNHGRHMGWINNFNKKQFLIQPGDLVSVSWYSRISNQLGFFKIELIETTVGKIFNDKIRLDLISPNTPHGSFHIWGKYGRVRENGMTVHILDEKYKHGNTTTTNLENIDGKKYLDKSIQLQLKRQIGFGR